MKGSFSPEVKRLCYNLAMDRKRVLKKKINYQLKAKIFFLIFVILGGLMTSYGAAQLYQFRKERGNSSVEKLERDIENLEKEAEEINHLKEQEYAEHDASQRYFELSNEWAEKIGQKTSAEKQVYMANTGYHNPRNIFEYITMVPLLFLGLIFILIGFILHRVIKKHGRKELREMKQAALKAKEED